MAGYGYSYRSQSPDDGFDPWKAERSRNSERGPNMELSKPINDIDMALEYLKKVSSGNTIKDEAPDPSHFKGDKIPKPPVATGGGPTARPGHPRGSMLPNYYISSEIGERTIQPELDATGYAFTIERNYHEQVVWKQDLERSERGRRTIQPPSRTMIRGWDRRGHDMGLEPMNETGKAAEYSKEAVKPPPASTVPKRDSNPETIDSNEVVRRYNGQFVWKRD